MKEPVKFDKVADIYDFYVNIDFDIPFFLKETEGIKDEILELISGTGLEIAEIYGDYSYNPFDEATSNFMVYKMIKR